MALIKILLNFISFSNNSLLHAFQKRATHVVVEEIVHCNFSELFALVELLLGLPQLFVCLRTWDGGSNFIVLTRMKM